MKKYKKVMKEVEELEDVICDICGKSCMRDYDSIGRHPEFATLTYNWGYWSNHDGLSGEKDICEECYHEIENEARRKQK